MARPSVGNADVLRELEALSQTLYQSHNSRRAASLSVNPNRADATSKSGNLEEGRSESRSRTRRMSSMSPWRSRPSSKRQESDGNGGDDRRRQPSGRTQTHAAAAEEKKGIWNWKPIRAISHMTMEKIGCLLSVEVIAIQGLPASMNGLRLSVSVRKKEVKDGAVQTMPARVLQGAADFEETMFIRCNLYYSGGPGSGKSIKFEARPFYISVVATDAPELDFGKNGFDLSLIMKESMEKNLKGERIRHWDRSFRLAEKANGGELVVRLGFQIMEDGGAGIYSDPAGRQTPVTPTGKQSPSIARKQSKSSFSITSPRIPSKLEFPATTSKSADPTVDFKEIDDFKLDEPSTTPSTSFAPATAPAPAQMEVIKLEDHEFPDFDVVDKGIEVEDEEKPEKEQRRPEKEEEKCKAKSASREEVIVKEVVVQQPAHRRRLTELDSIAKQLTALESMLNSDVRDGASKNDLETDDENATREFLQLLELEEKRFEFDQRSPPATTPKSPGSAELDNLDAKSFVPDLGKGLGAVVRTKDGGYLVAANPFGVEVPRTETPKLAIQISRALVLKTQKSATGFELFQRMAAMGSAKLGSQLLSMTAMNELMGKTSEQVAFEGIASKIVSGRHVEGGASSSAATLVAKLKSMSTSMTVGRKERILTGIWTAGEEPVDAEELLSYTLQRIESMAVQALKIQADTAEEDAPFDVFPLAGKGDPNSPLSSAVTLDEWTKTNSTGGGGSGLTVAVVVQTRDPVRRYEKLGAPVVAMVQAAWVGNRGGAGRYKVGSVHLAGMRTMVDGGGGGGWDGEKERLTAAQWLAAYGVGRKAKAGPARTAAVRGRAGGRDLLWSLSSRVVADTWLEPTRNPDVKFPT